MDTERPGNEETALDRLNQLAEAGATTRGEVATLVAEVVALRGRLDEAERQLAAVREARTLDIDRLERIVGERNFGERFEQIEERLVAALAAGQRTAERVEDVAAEMARFNRFDGALENVRRDVAEQIASHVESHRAERAVSEARQDRRIAEIADSLREHVAAVAEFSPLAERIDSLERSRKGVEDDAQRAVVAIEKLVAERSVLTDTIQRGVSDMKTRADDLGADVETLREEIGGWQSRIEHQVTVVEAAKVTAESMRASGEELLAAQREAAEAQRVFEERIDAALGEVRRESTDEWTSFMVQREREHEQSERVLREEFARRDEEVKRVEAAIDERIEAWRAEVERGRQALETDLLDLRQMLLGALSRWRDSLDDLVKDSEASIPSDAKPHLVAERRRALRRSLRASRDARDEDGA